MCVVVDVNPDGGNRVTVIGQPSVYRPDWMRKPNWVVNDCRETDADEEQDDDRSRPRLQRPLVIMMRVYAALGRQMLNFPVLYQ